MIHKKIIDSQFANKISGFHIVADDKLTEEYANEFYAFFIRYEKIDLNENGENIVLISFFRKSEKADRSYYEIEADNGELRVAYSDMESVRNAIIDILNCLYKSGEDIYFKNFKMKEYPDSTHRGLMLDLAREYIEMDKIKYYIHLMAKSKYNVLHLHLMDSENYALRSEALPQLHHTSQYSKDEFLELDKFALLYQIKIIPEIDIPAHAQFLIKNIPRIKCEIDNADLGNWTVCIGNEQTYNIIEQIVIELVEIFSADIIHIGGDELEFYDIPQLGYWPQWENCKCCEERARTENMNTKREYFYYFLRRVYEILQKYGKRMMMWNDGIDISQSPNLPRDILIHFWRVAMDTRGPNQGCSLERFLEEGFEVVNSSYLETYIDCYIKEEKLAKWSPFSSLKCDDKYKKQILGGEMCAWEGKKHFAWTLPSAIVMFGERLWNEKPAIVDREYEAKITKIILSLDVPSGFNLFKLLGGCILPLVDEKRGYYSNNQAQICELDEGIEVLKRIENPSFTINEYIKCLEWIKEKIQFIQSISYEQFERNIKLSLENITFNDYEKGLISLLLKRGSMIKSNDLIRGFMTFTSESEYRDIKMNIVNGILPPFTTCFSKSYENSGNGYLIWAIAFLGNNEITYEFAKNEACIYLKEEHIENYIFSAVFLSEYILTRDIERSKNIAVDLLKTEKRFDELAEKLIKKHFGASNQTNITDTNNLISAAFAINRSISEKDLRIIELPSAIESFYFEEDEKEFDLEVNYADIPFLKDGKCEFIASLSNNTDRSFSAKFSLRGDDGEVDCQFIDENMVVTGYNKKEFRFFIAPKFLLNNKPTKFILEAYDEKQGITIKNAVGVFV